MSSTFKRGTGVLVINVVNSNPNGDPDGESEPRTFEGDGRGLISPVSFKRKLRDLMENETGQVRKAAIAAIGKAAAGRFFDILESRARPQTDQRLVPGGLPRQVLGRAHFWQHLR